MRAIRWAIILFIGHLFKPTSRRSSSPRDYSSLTVRDQMNSHWFHGRTEEHWLGTSPAYIDWHARTSSSRVEKDPLADAAESRKRAKYEEISATHIFQPIAIETLGGLGTDTLRFITSLGKRVTQATGDDRATIFLRQGLGIAVQRGTAAVCLKLLLLKLTTRLVPTFGDNQD